MATARPSTLNGSLGTVGPAGEGLAHLIGGDSGFEFGYLIERSLHVVIERRIAGPLELCDPSIHPLTQNHEFTKDAGRAVVHRRRRRLIGHYA